MLINDIFGGTIHKIRIDGDGTYYFNKINGNYYVTTRIDDPQSVRTFQNQMQPSN